MLTAAEVRERLGIGRSKLEELIKSGELRAIKLGDSRNSSYRISEEALAEYIARQSVKSQTS